jgi:hypothetical protein
VPFETRAFIGEKGPRFEVLSLFAKALLSRRPVLVEKTPRHIYRVEQIRQLVPGAKFIVATRDGRDVVASMGKRYGNYEKAFRRWVKDTTRSIQTLESPDSILWKYEDFIDDPELSLRRICDFVGIEYLDDLLNYHKHPVDWGKRKERGANHRELRNTQVNRPITDGRGNWKNNLPENFVPRFSEDSVQALVKRLGYSIE